MNNKKKMKGFTLIEVIAAVIILGIISIVAIVTYTGSMKEFRESYYSSLERTLVESGKEFFEDNRNYRPSTVFGAQKVPISLLESKSYIDDVNDYNGKKCDKSSYVIIIKHGRNDYIYHACLSCSEDTYSNIDDKYCDSSWDDPTLIRYTLGSLSDAYVYKNTTQEKLREKLETAISITKFDRAGNVIDTISGDGIDDVPKILPENIDIIDTTKIGTYTVTYKYGDKSVTRRVHVYENDEPEVVLHKTNVYADKIVENNVTEKTAVTNYASGDWAQEVNMSFAPGSVFYSSSNAKVSVYQWNKDGTWQTICTVNSENGTCSINYRQEMNEEVAFRAIDSEGNISKTTTSVTIRVDRTEPICTLTREGTAGLNDWFHSDVTVKFDTIKDQTSAIAVAKSDLRFNQIRRGNAAYNSTNPGASNLQLVHDYDSQYVTYYGFVEDKAQNYAKCSAQVRKDSVLPSCSITNHATLKCSDETSKLVKVYFGQTDNSDEGTSLNYVQSWTDTGSVNKIGRWYLKATDHSGYTFQTSSMYYLVTYDKNGGDTGPTKASEIKRETELADLTPTARKAAYKMIGWHNSKTSTTALSTYTVNSNVTLYAVYVKCDKGYYTDAVGTSCTQCPEGYTDGEPVGTKAECKKKVTPGHFVESSNDPDQTECAKGYYSTEHYVKYGNTSQCTICPEGYRDGTALDNKISENSCLKKVPNGEYVEKEKDKNSKKCAAGYYNTAHNLTYGQKSACTKCTAGYYNTTEGNSSCSACGKGYYCAGGTDRHGCDAGYYGKDGVTTGSTRDNACNACGQGYYCGGINDRHGCDAGYYGKDGVTTGSTRTNACNECGKGYYCGGINDRHGCDAGYYGKETTTGSTRDNACNECGQGYYCAGVNDRHGCPTKYVGKTGVKTGSTRDNACDLCSAGYYCTGINNKTACVTGAWSAAGSDTCTACTGKTTSSTAQSSCNANCSNAAHVKDWVTASWTPNTVSNLCKINSCNTGYELKNNACVAKSFTVTYKAGCFTGNDVTQSVTYDSAWTTKTAQYSKTGYTQTGWSTTSGGSITHNLNTNQGAYTTDGDTTLYATCSANTYTLTYDSNEGDACNPTTKTITYGSTYGDLCSPSRSGYTFDGWFTAASGGTQITKDSTVAVTSNQTLYAHWTRSAYTITYNANGGSGSMAATTCNYGSDCTLSTNAFTAPVNKSFLGWSTTANGAEVYLDGATVRDIGNTTLYAKWANMKCYNTCSAMGTRCFFQGSNPDNYVTFNNETWRIVSIETSGEMQIIRNDVLSDSMAFGAKNNIFAAATPKINNNDYSGSALSTYLEDTYYTTLTQTAKNMISKRKQKFGFYDSPPDSDKCKMKDTDNYNNSGKSMYCYYWEQDHKYTTKDELYFTALTISDYLYGGPGENTSNWLVAGKDKYYWASTNKSNERARVIGSDGCFKYFPQSYTYYVRPVTYLKSSVRISGGSGTATDPYTLQ